MHEFLISGFISGALIALCGLLIYELLRFVWRRLPGMRAHPRLRIGFVITTVFLGHILNIWLFGITYWLLVYAGVGKLAGGIIDRGEYALDFFGCLYFSSVTYSTLGLGDVTPEGALRMLAGAEALTGFILIGWTVSFTYLTMEKFWELPHSRHKDKGA